MAKRTGRKNKTRSQRGRRKKLTRASSCKCATAGGLNQTCHGFTGGVSKHGGDVLKNAKVAAIYWGSYFATNPDVTTTFDQFFANLFASTYLDSLQQYGVNGATYMGGSTLFGGLHPSQGGVESQIQSWLSRGQLPIPGSQADAQNWLYVLVPPPGEIVFDNGDESDVNLCGYHGHHSFRFNTSGFGNLVAAGCRFFVGSFSQPTLDEILFYSPFDGNWWLGTFAGEQLFWTLAGNTTGFGNISNDPFYLGDFTGSGQTSILFYSPGDFNWWLGTFSGTQLTWNLAGNTKGFGQVNDGRPFWVGRFSAANRDNILFYFPGDGNWWLGSFAGNQLSWTLAGNTGKPGSGFGNISKDPFYVGDFTGSGRSSLLFYSPGDFNWWLGTFSGAQLSWNLAGNTAGFGQVNDGRPFWVGPFSAANRDNILFYFPGDGNWWLGSFVGNQLSWSLAGNTGITVNFSADVPYAVVAFPVPASGSSSLNVVNSIAYCLSHEMVEAMSNPRQNGFHNDNGCEIGDICEADPKTGNIVTVAVGKWFVEKYWSNSAKGCVSS
jgi:hypothetical protein